MSKEINKGVEAILLFQTRATKNGELVNAASLPVILRILVNGVQTTVAGSSIAQAEDDVPASITGNYLLRVPTSTFSVNDQIHAYVQADVNGMVIEVPICFSIVDQDAGTPVIRVC